MSRFTKAWLMWGGVTVAALGRLDHDAVVSSVSSAAS
jgi:hypothetical protein